ncbi:MAG: ComF family protein [Lachnospiraceae bacterium]|nr:ComF family protein [Lachnospiraceae bacterium]
MTFFRELLYPRRCPGCDEILFQKEWSRGFCQTCDSKITRIGDAGCIKCGKPLQKVQEEFCYDCKRKHHFFEENRGVYVYRGPMKLAMYRLKYSNRRCYAKTFAREAYEAHGLWIKEKGIQCIVPIPMFPGKMRARGYNQATVLAKELGKLAGLPVYDNLVFRVRNSTPQKELNDIERKNNLKNAFKIRKSDVKLKKILLIDDIYTTGATMDEVCRTLRDGGVEQVYCLSICMGEGRE